METRIRNVIKTWKAIRRWQNTGDDGRGNTCAIAVFSAHEDALLDLESILCENITMDLHTLYIYKKP